MVAVAAEVACVLAVAVAVFLDQLPERVPPALPLLVVASASLWLRGESWATRIKRTTMPRALAAGTIAGGVAIAISLPSYDAFRVTAVDWWLLPATHGDVGQVVLACLLAIATAIASELVFRGWIVERTLALSPGPPALPVATAALAELLVWPGPLAARLGIALFSLGLGAVYIAAGRNLLAPIVARSVFATGAVIASTLGVAS